MLKSRPFQIASKTQRIMGGPDGARYLCLDALIRIFSDMYCLRLVCTAANWYCRNIIMLHQLPISRHVTSTIAA